MLAIFSCHQCFKWICHSCLDTLTSNSLFQLQSPQVIFVVASPQIELPMSKKKAKIICGLGITQLTLGILEVVFNIGASVMGAFIADFVGHGYWCGPFVSHFFSEELVNLTTKVKLWTWMLLAKYVQSLWIQNLLCRLKKECFYNILTQYVRY